MANSLTTGSSTVDASQYTTAEIQPTRDALVLAFVSNVRPALTFGTLAAPAVSSNGLTWEVVNTVLAPDGERRLTCLRARGPSPARGSVVIDFADQIQEMGAWSIVEYTGVDATGVNGAGAIGFSQPVNADGVRLDATFTPADLTRDRTIGAIMLQPRDGQARPVTPGTAFTEIHEQTPTQFGNALTLQTQDAAPGTTQIGWTWTGSQAAVALLVSVKSPRPGGPSGNPTVDLIRRYEPILHLHQQESFVPVNAKRYVEAAALWGGKPPFDAKSGWGTAPLVKSGQLSAAQNEAGEYLGKPDYIAANATRERFLELGAWKDRNGSREPGVTATSTNVYVDRAEIVRRYATDLADSTYWYHAELYPTARLKALAAKAVGVDLAATLTTNFKNPILLCYYLFYPAHEQSVGREACPNIEAKEFASHAGDWHCFALLLDGQGTPSPDTYTPMFFGVTGSRPAPEIVGGVESFRPHAFDAEGRTVMKVEPWRRGSATTTVQPDVVADHPQFYVARGSHSMYTSAGTKEVSPFEDARTPAGCGRFDSPSAIPPSRPPTPGTSPPSDSFIENGWIVLLTKMTVGGLLAPVGFVVGLVAGIIEGIPKATPDFGSEPYTPPPPPTFDPPNADAPPTAAGQGLTLRPKDLAIPGVTANVFNWKSDQNVTAAGRQYDFIVDRATQVWWPSDDGTAGFRGRWGQRVDSDPVSHRAGVKFPEFWKMFVTALEQGFGEGKLTRPAP